MFHDLLHKCSRALHSCRYRQQDLRRFFVDRHVIERAEDHSVKPRSRPATTNTSATVCFTELDARAWQPHERLTVVACTLLSQAGPSMPQQLRGSTCYNIQLCRRMTFAVSPNTRVTFEAYREGLRPEQRQLRVYHRVQLLHCWDDTERCSREQLQYAGAFLSTLLSPDPRSRHPQQEGHREWVGGAGEHLPTVLHEDLAQRVSDEPVHTEGQQEG
jgi:hypothetical protein